MDSARMTARLRLSPGCRLPRCSATLTGSSLKEGDLLMLARKGGAAEGAPPQSHPMAMDREGNPLNTQVYQL